MTTSTVVRAALAAACVALAACSGSTSVMPRASSQPSSPAAPTAKKATAQVAVKLSIPAHSTRDGRRGPKYVSSSTMSAAVLVNGAQAVAFSTQSGSSNCTSASGGLVCSASVYAPVGTDTFTLNTYDGALASGATSGNLLSTGTASSTIVVSTANSVNLTLSGVVSSIALSAGSVPAGTATSAPVNVMAMDPDGNVIVGPGGYVDANGNPVTISVSDTDPTNTTTLSASSVSAPSSLLTVSYSGTQPHGLMPTFGATEGSLSAPAYAFQITPSAQLLSATLSGAGDGGMTLGPDGNLYLLETQINPYNSTGDGIPEIAKVSVTKGTLAEYAYEPCGKPNMQYGPTGLTSGPDGRIYMTTFPCSSTPPGDLVAMTTGGTFTTYPSTLSSYGYISKTYAAFSSNGNLVGSGLVGCCIGSPPSPAPDGGDSYVSSSTTGTGQFLNIGDALGLVPFASDSAGDETTQRFTAQGGAAIDANGNLDIAGQIQTFTQYAAGGDLSNLQYPIVISNASGATAYEIPNTGGTTGAFTFYGGMTEASDGNVWFSYTDLPPGGVFASGTPYISSITPAGTITQYPIPAGNGESAYIPNEAVVDGLNGAVYSLLQGASGGGTYILRATRSGQITVVPTGVSAGQFGYGVRTASGDIYVDIAGNFAGSGIVQILY